MNLSRMEAGAKSVTQSNDFVVHALRRDSEGMLHIQKLVLEVQMLLISID